MTKTKRQGTPSCADSCQPTTWAVDPMGLARDITRQPVDICRPAADPMTWAADLTRPTTTHSATAAGARVSFMNGMTPGAPTVANESAQGATAGGNTAPRPAPSEPIANGNANGTAPESNAAGGVDSTSTKPNATVTRCEQCGVEFLPKSRLARFCSPYCRRRAWLARNPEKAAVLAERDRARLRAHVVARGGVWVERGSAQ